MFNCLLEFVPMLALVIWERTRTKALIYSLISLCGTPVIYHIGMEASRNTDLEHARNRVKIFEKSPVAVKLENQPKREIKDDVRVMDIDLE